MKHNYRQEIRFSDIDALGHVNNAVYLNYFEQARVSFFKEINDGPWDWSKQGILLARNEVDYKVPVLFGDEVVTEVWVEKIGTKSFVLAYDLFKVINAEKVKCSSGASVLVAYDFEAGHSTVIPELWKNKLKKWLNMSN